MLENLGLLKLKLLSYGELVGCKLAGKWVKVGELDWWYVEPNDETWLVFKMMEFAYNGVFGLEEYEELYILFWG